MSAPASDPEEALTARLQRITAELRELDSQIRSAQVDLRVLNEFRAALDRVRLTAWGLRTH